MNGSAMMKRLWQAGRVLAERCIFNCCAASTICFSVATTPEVTPLRIFFALGLGSLPRELNSDMFHCCCVQRAFLTDCNNGPRPAMLVQHKAAKLSGTISSAWQAPSLTARWITNEITENYAWQAEVIGIG